MATLVKSLPLGESLERIKAEIVKFLTIRFDYEYDGAEGKEFKGINFDYQWTCGELSECYVPSEGLTLYEISEVAEYINHYGYKNEDGSMEYNGILKDWNGIEIAKRKVEEKHIYDADGTIKANDLLKGYAPLSEEEKLEVLQIVTQRMLEIREVREVRDADGNESWCDFYARGRRIAKAICDKYKWTDCSAIGYTLWEIAEHYCDVVKDVKVINCNFVATEYYCD